MGGRDAVVSTKSHAEERPQGRVSKHALDQARARDHSHAGPGLLDCRAMNKAQSALFFDRLAAAIPVPKGELSYRNSYTLLVAVVLSAQATDVGVNRATGPLFELPGSPARMA